MLTHYFKIAIAVLKRRRFFTFISLFGISFTLAIIILLSSLTDHLLSPSYPDVNRDRELFITEVKMIDKKGFLNIGQLSLHFLEAYVSKMKMPAALAFATEPRLTNTYANNTKIDIDVKYTNDQFWNVFQYEFVEGKPYGKQQIDNSDKVVVISTDTRTKYFGESQTAAGKYIEIDNVQYRITGVVKTVPVSFRFNYSDAFLPYTESRTNRSSKSFMGNFTATLLAHKKEDLPKVQEEYQQLVSRIPLDGKEFKKMYSYAGTYLTTFTRVLVSPFNHNNDSGVAKTFTIIGILLVLFMLLPTLNLVNINISRITERYSEIGIRKAFGASPNTLALQFVAENILLTLVGGIIGTLLAFGIIQIFNSSQVVDNLHLVINFKVLFASLVACLLLGLASGVYPAWRMSRLQVATALKA